MTARHPLSSSVPQTEAPARTPSAPAPDAVPNASTVAAPAPLGAATHITTREALAASAVGIAIALAGVAPAAATADSGAGITPTGDGILVVALLVAVALLVVAALLHGRPRRARRVVESGCCLVEHGPADDDEIAAGVGER
ncbi:hypothetical protein ACLBWJ_13195 [Microbacterium sp. M4A5_1d]